MTILQTVDRCLNMIPKELINDKILYVEVDGESYEGLDGEFSKLTSSPDVLFVEQKIADIGKCKVFTFGEYKVIITSDKKKTRSSSFYVAFKTKVL